MAWLTIVAIYFLLWWVVLFAVMPFSLKTQDEAGDVTLGTVRSAPRGPHALRASLASAMLDQHTPLPVISEALTHANSDTTRIYLKIDLQHLREYSLEVPPLGNVWLGGVAR